MLCQSKIKIVLARGTRNRKRTANNIKYVVLGGGGGEGGRGGDEKVKCKSNISKRYIPRETNATHLVCGKHGCNTHYDCMWQEVGIGAKREGGRVFPRLERVCVGACEEVQWLPVVE